MAGRNTLVANEGDDEARVYLRPGITVHAEAGIELTAIEFGREHCTLKATAKAIGGRVKKLRQGRAFILTLV